jgi:SEL1 protein
MFDLALAYLNGTDGVVNCPGAVQLLKAVAERGRVADRAWPAAAGPPVAPRADPRYAVLETAYRAYQRGDRERARALYERLAALGSMEAQTNAAFLLTHDAAGDPATERRALALLTLAAEQGSTPALVEVGDAHYYGRGVSAPSAAAAVAWYRLAAEQQHAQALFNVGWAHHVGDGARRDLHRAKHFYDLAMEHSRDALVPATLAVSLLRLQLGLGERAAFVGVAAQWIAARWDALLLTAAAVALVTALAVRRGLVRRAAPPQQ